MVQTNIRTKYMNYTLVLLPDGIWTEMESFTCLYVHSSFLLDNLMRQRLGAKSGLDSRANVCKHAKCTLDACASIDRSIYTMLWRYSIKIGSSDNVSEWRLQINLPDLDLDGDDATLADFKKLTCEKFDQSERFVKMRDLMP